MFQKSAFLCVIVINSVFAPFRLSFLICLLAGQSVFAQLTEIRGKIIDGKTKEPLSYANVRLKGTITATTSDDGGFYYLNTVEKADSIIFSYLGYPSKAYKIKRGSTQVLNVEMGSENIELTQVTIKAGKRKKYVDTTANYVYHKVVKNKSTNREDNLDSYKLEEYQKLEVGLLNPREKFINRWYFKPFRFVFDNKDTIDEGKVYIRGIIKEDLTDVYYRKKPKVTRRYTKATQITGIDNISISELANGTFITINVYDNLFVLAGKSFVSPFSPGALATYRYFLTDTQQVDNRTTYKIHFVGISKVDLALKGYAWIDSATWAIQSIYFRPNEKSNLNFISDYSISQTFKLINNKTWMLKGENVQSVGSIFKRKNAMSVIVQRFYDRRNIEVNIPLEDSLFSKGDQEIVAEDARTKGREYWEENRDPQLNKFEKKVFWIHDTIPKVPMFKTYMWTIKLLTTAYFQAGPVEFGRFYKFASKNNIEGWRIRFGLQTNKYFSKKVYFSSYVAYGTKDKDWKYEAIFKSFIPSQNEKWRMLTMYYRYDLNVLGQENQLITFDNILTLVRGRLLTRMMKIREAHVDIENEWTRGFSSIMGLTNKTFYAIPGVFDFNYNTPSGTPKQLKLFNTTEIGIDSRYAPNGKYYKAGFYRWFVKTKYPEFMFKYNLGFLNMANRVSNYHKLSLTITQRLSWQLGHTNYKFEAAKMFGKVPYPLSYVTAAGFGIILDRTNFNMLKEFEFVNDQYMTLWIEHHFDGFFFNKIPVFNKLKLREVIYFRGLWGSYSKANAALINLPSEVYSPSKIPYMEASFGIENILNVFRVDFMWRLTYRDTPGVPKFMVKIGFTPNF